MKQRAKVTSKRKAAPKGISLKASSGTRWRGPAAGMEEYYKPIKKPITLRLDADVLAWFKRQGRGYQTRINRALRKVMTEAGR
jgi:uncharacterized protein (DUF4415 family)